MQLFHDNMRTDSRFVLPRLQGLAGGVVRISNLSRLVSDGDRSRTLAIMRNLK